MNPKIDNRLSVAPMLDWTDKHCRYLHRLISPDVLLYTEMVTTPAILQGDTDKYISYNEEEHPVVLQLGGSSPDELARCSAVAQKYGYDAVNLNVGCPSDRVQKGRFGACLMNEPDLVSTCVKRMMEEVDIPVTVKCRIGVDQNDSFESLQNFILQIREAGIGTVIIHARKAWLKGLSPKQNRSIPPLNYDFVYKIKQLFPEMQVIINGGIGSVADVENHLQRVDGVMLGRAIWTNPWLLYELQNKIFESKVSYSRKEVLQEYIEYCRTQVEQGVKLHWLIPPVLGLFHGLPGNKKWKCHLVSETPGRNNDFSVFDEAGEFLR